MGGDAVVHQAYAGAHLCERHLCRAVEQRIRSRVREDGLLPDDATAEGTVTWLVGLSGGKDSAVLLHVLEDTFAADPRVELVALTVHEGIEGYREESLSACEALAADRDVRHEVRTYAEEFDVEMDSVAAADPLGMTPCAYCGVFRRDVLARYAAELDADLLLTGHNLDDEAETALMNLLEGDVDRVARHYDASLGPMSDRNESEAFVPRAKPLRDVPEKEVALYARLRDLPVHVAACPHASEAFRGEVKELLLALEEDHPGTRHSILAGYEELASLAAAEHRGDDGALGECEECGAPTARNRCRTCGLLAALDR